MDMMAVSPLRLAWSSSSCSSLWESCRLRFSELRVSRSLLLAGESDAPGVRALLGVRMDFHSGWAVGMKLRLKTEAMWLSMDQPYAAALKRMAL